ncbi:50S ribosomal protein L20 [Candidatus Shikimatogenerans silvanidophilus]|uniref:50S ribosomal protein L20 n=1 Tax=Candidatus Shikimatogenerans silvanidophilus TaxID=2782547 RepID=UPI001BA61C78|nr:50S ribosomal protein L20 [Candidatus Shikimatogenerans silvanidophilus]
MPRSVNSVSSKKRRKKIIKMAKGYYGARSKVYTVAKNAVERSLIYSYIGRKQKKRNFRSLWIQRINARCRMYNLSYSKFIAKLRIKNIIINRKFLSDLSINYPDYFNEIINMIK